MSDQTGKALFGSPVSDPQTKFYPILIVMLFPQNINKFLTFLKTFAHMNSGAFSYTYKNSQGRNPMLKKYLIYLPLIMISLLFMCYCHMANRPADPRSSIHTVTEIPPDHIPPAASTPPAPRLHAAAACVMDAGSGRILYGKCETSPLPMASTTKIMTCILALENGNMQDPVTFSSKAASMPKVRLGAGKGKTFLLGDLLYSLMLESHNDTAVAIAEHLGNSVEGFAAMMNAKASELGMNQTNFVTPNGLDAEGHASTPADMCRLASYACNNQAFLELIRTPSRTIRETSGKGSYSLTNHDAFLTSYEGAIGIKTGFTNKAGYCFVGAARRNSLTLVSCVLGSGWPPNKSYKWTDTKALMNLGFENFSMKNIPVRDLSAYSIAVENGKADAVAIRQPEIPSFLLSSSDTIDICYSLPSRIQAPVRQGTAIGEIQILVNGSPLGNYPVYPSEDVEKQTFADIVYDIFHMFLSF